ncbi:unnamed protein product [Adineta steineri]|uniref:VCBS repeat-containing protein n=1 Tax=Adineta steineri TaxID=433720 RepID=A0A819UE15_9BILA|nr:unnamed protein product [Adineta steineri]CAF4078810.1 unnamed protein product [Adineta steineri]
MPLINDSSIGVCANAGITTPIGLDTSPCSVSVGDFNGDSQPDLVTGNWQSSTVSVLINAGNGTFISPVLYQAGVAPRGIAIGDVNGDGHLDLVISNSGGICVLINTGDGSFVNFSSGNGAYLVVAQAYYVALGDFNNDALLDLVVGNTVNSSISVLLNTVSGAFGNQVIYATARPSVGVAVGDFNVDGNLDIGMKQQVEHHIGV